MFDLNLYMLAGATMSVSPLSVCRERSLGRSEVSMQEVHLVVRGVARSESSCNNDWF